MRVRNSSKVRARGIGVEKLIKHPKARVDIGEGSIGGEISTSCLQENKKGVQLNVSIFFILESFRCLPPV